MKLKLLQSRKQYTHYTIALTGQDNTSWITCRAVFSGVDIVRMGIKEALKHCPKPTKEMLKYCKNLVK